MGWRTIVVTQHAKISYSMHNLVVQTDLGVNHIPISDIQLLIVDSMMVMISSKAIAEIAKVQGKIIFSGNDSEPSAQLVSQYSPSTSSQSLIKQVHWQDNYQSIEKIWTKIVANKILNQIKVAGFYNKNIDDLLNEYNQLLLNDESNREAVVARKYFKLMKGDEFSRRDFSAFNAALNYGYSILLAAVNLAIVANGHVTEIGIHHDNVENEFNLGSDLMEPFRPIIDQWLFNKKFIEFTPDIKFGLIQLLDIEIRFNDHSSTLRNAINEHVANCLRYLDGLTKEIVVEVDIPDEVSSNAFNDNV